MYRAWWTGTRDSAHFARCWRKPVWTWTDQRVGHSMEGRLISLERRLGPPMPCKWNHDWASRPCSALVPESQPTWKLNLEIQARRDLHLARSRSFSRLEAGEGPERRGVKSE